MGEKRGCELSDQFRYEQEARKFLSFEAIFMAIDRVSFLLRISKITKAAKQVKVFCFIPFNMPSRFCV